VLQTGYNNFFGATRLVFSPDGRLLATGTFRSNTIKLWDTTSGRELRNLSSGKQSAMGMSPAIYGPVDDAESIRTLHRSLDLGMTFLDTAELYGGGHNEELVGKTGIRAGVALLQSLHSTAALFVNEWQEALLEDFRTLLEQAVRAEAPWRHNDPRYSDCDRSNAASHLRALLLGSSAMLAVRRGRLVRGTWQSIILAELDGPRTRSVSLQILGA